MWTQKWTEPVSALLNNKLCIPCMHLVKSAAGIFQACIHQMVGQAVLKTRAHLLYKLWSVLQQELPSGQPVQGIDRQHSIPADIGVPVLQASQDGGNERLQDLLFPDAAQEAQRDAPDVLVGMLQVVAQVLADEDLQAGTGALCCMCHTFKQKYVSEACERRSVRACPQRASCIHSVR